MKIFSLFGRRFLEKTWSFTPHGTIWRLLPTDTGEFLGEVRDQERKQVSFFAVDAASGNVLWQDLRLEEPWWVGVEDAAHGVALFHKFATPDMPQHKGIVALNLADGRRLWENQDLTFWFTRNSTIVAYKTQFERRIVADLDVHTGQVTREYDADKDSASLQDYLQTVPSNHHGLIFPEVLEPGSTDIRVMQMVSKELPPEGVQGNVEFLISDELLLFSYHARSKNSSEETLLVDNWFKVIDIGSGRVLFKDVMARDSRAPVPDSFFVRNGMGYYIKDQETLTAVRFVE